MRKLGGSIAIYTTLIFTCILALVLTLIEGARYEYCGACLSVISRNSMESVFADYAREILDEYGLFLNVRSDEEFQNNLESFLGDNVSIKKEDDLIDFLNVESENLEELKIKHITDDGGSIFAKEVSDYMKYRIGEDAAEKLIDLYGGSIDGGSISDFIKSVRNAKATVEQIADAASDLYDLYEKVKKTAGTIPKDVKNTKKAIKKLKETLAEYSKGECEFEDVERAYNIVVGQVDNIRNDFDDIKEAAIGMADKKKEYEEGKKETTDVYEDVFGEGKITNEKDELVDKYEDVCDIVEIIDGIDLSDFDKTVELSEKNVEKIIKRRVNKLLEDLDKTDGLVDIAKEIVFDDISDDPEDSLEKENGDGISGDDIIDFLKDFSNDAYLSLVTDVSSISPLTMEKDEYYPSNIKEKGAGKISKVDDAMFSLYCGDIFASFTDKKSDLLINYEMEYVLNGRSSDKANLRDTVTKILAAREVTNIITILSNPDMVSSARTLSLSTFGLTGIPAIAFLGEILIIATWGFGESIMDVRDLLNGERCKLIKGRDDFVLGLSNIGAVISGTFVKEKRADKSKKDSILDGLNYKDFLELMIFAIPSKLKYYRCMDLIEFRERSKVSDFRMSNCIVSAKAVISFEINPVFISEDSSKKIKSDGKILIKRNVSYEY